MQTCSNNHPILAYGVRFCGFCGVPVPYVGDPSVRREFHWVPESRRITMPSTEVPVNVWTLIGVQARDPSREPDPIHGDPKGRPYAFHEDRGHDWQMEGNVLRYFSRGDSHSVWILVEYPVQEP
jgi:hypothetical protein